MASVASSEFGDDRFKPRLEFQYDRKVPGGVPLGVGSECLSEAPCQQDADMDGVPASGLLAPRRAAPPPAVKTHDTEAWREAHRSLAGELPAMDARIEQLRALGYLEQASP